MQSSVLKVVEEKPFVSRALYVWTDGPSDKIYAHSQTAILRNSILASKGTANREIYRVFAEEMFRRSVAEGLWRERRDWIFIVPPSVRIQAIDQARDHASELATQLSNLTGSPFSSEPTFQLGPKGVSQQKTKSRKDRESKQFFLSQRMSTGAKDRLLGAPGFLFLDDVIATGATAKAAWTALGKPAAFEAWAIAWRGLPQRGGVDRQ